MNVPPGPVCLQDHEGSRNDQATDVSRFSRSQISCWFMNLSRDPSPCQCQHKQDPLCTSSIVFFYCGAKFWLDVFCQTPLPLEATFILAMSLILIKWLWQPRHGHWWNCVQMFRKLKKLCFGSCTAHYGIPRRWMNSLTVCGRVSHDVMNIKY